MFDLVIKNGLVVGLDKICKQNIYIKDEKIVAISGEDFNVDSDELIDANGKMVFPGGIDTHAHLNDPGYNWREDFIHGSSAAAAGGITTIIDMPLQNEPALTSNSIFHDKQRYLEDKSVVDYGFWGGLINNNLSDIEGLNEAGVVALKAFIGPVSSDYSSIDMGIVREAMKIAVKLDLRIGFHCEDYSIIKMNEKIALENNRLTRRDFLDSRPVIAEMIATKNIIDLARETGAKVHICHVSHPAIAMEIKKAIYDGIDIIGETCSHYLLFTEDDVLNKGSLFKCAPPLRTANDREELWKYVIDGTLSCVASDHSPCSAEEKSEEKQNIFSVWGGISGIQSTFQIMFNEVVNKRSLCPTLLTKSLAYGPSKAFGLYPKKGLIEVGADADIVIVDPNMEWEITPESLFYKNKISAFVGQKGKGLPIQTIVRGKIVYSEGNIKAEYGYGKLVKKAKLVND